MPDGKARIPPDKRLWQVTIEKALHKQFKIRCVEEGITMNAKIADLIRAYLTKSGKRHL
jgi:hypothetical protein